MVNRFVGVGVCRGVEQLERGDPRAHTKGARTDGRTVGLSFESLFDTRDRLCEQDLLRRHVGVLAEVTSATEVRVACGLVEFLEYREGYETIIRKDEPQMISEGV